MAIYKILEWKKKEKIVKFSGWSIWRGMPHILYGALCKSYGARADRRLQSKFVLWTERRPESCGGAAGGETFDSIVTKNLGWRMVILSWRRRRRSISTSKGLEGLSTIAHFTRITDPNRIYDSLNLIYIV